MSRSSPGAAATTRDPENAASLRVLLVHNRYREPGGEDAVVASEADLLRAAGHEVREYTKANVEIGSDPLSLLSAARGAVWSRQAYRALGQLVSRYRPAVVHFHNVFPLISPSVYHACGELGVPVVQTLHNYRLFCPAALLLRDGRICEECIEHSLWRGVRHGCYRGSRLATATIASSLALHRRWRTWEQQVDCYIALTEFARQKFVEFGLPAEKIKVKSNFLHPDPGVGWGGGGYAAFVGRLSPEKGIGTALRAWRRLAGRIPLKIVGDGPAALLVAEAARSLPGVEWLGWLPSAETLDVIGGASFVVFPSEWYEGCPRVIVESFAKGTPVLAARLGAAEELVEPELDGMHFQVGDAEDLARQAARLIADRALLDRLRVGARRKYESRFTGDQNYAQLAAIYQDVRRIRLGQ
jgi:glycosyltransferase involved in cell wall biosynthesis